MDARHGLFDLGAIAAAIKLYSWYQMRYWRSREFRDYLEQKNGKDSEADRNE